jgi:uncharacterized protein
MNTLLTSKAIFSETPICILLTGATGFIGKALVPLLLSQGHKLILWSRSPQKARAQYGYAIEAFAALDDIPEQKIHLVINLAGSKVAGMPWTVSRRKMLYESRVDLTQTLVSWLKLRQQKPALFLSASAIGYYGIQSQDDLTELTEEGLPQSIFMSQLCQDWEAAATEIHEQVPLVITRFGVVLGQGGALSMMLLPVRMGLGGKLGTGKQIMSWIHIEDLLSALAHLVSLHLQSPEIKRTVYNLTAPEAVSQIQFGQTAAKILHRPWCIPTPALAMKLLMGEQSCVLLEGQRVKPEALIKSGYIFEYPTLELALKNLLET